MPLVQTRGAASAQGFGEFAQAATAVNYIEEVFSTFLYTGTGAALTITNNIDLSTKGGLVWIKNRTTAYKHVLTDTARGVNKQLASSNTDAEAAETNRLTAFTTSGFTVSSGDDVNSNTNAIVSWTFRKQPKFFDIQTWTGSGANRTISHSLGSVPACIIVKRTDTTAAWAVYHRSLANTQYLVLNTTAAAATGATWWNSTTPTSSVFSLGTDATVNASAGTYVAYIFAHDAGGFGLTGTDNVISCGSFTTNGSGVATVNLGYEPQFVLFKRTDSAGHSWEIIDTMRGFSINSDGTTGNVKRLSANSSGAETTSSAFEMYLTSTGFATNQYFYNATYIYIAIRRGPMKVPTTGTSVYNGVARTGTGAATTVTSVGFTPDLVIATERGSTQSGAKGWYDRLRNPQNRVTSTSTAAETATYADSITALTMDGMTIGADSNNQVNYSAATYINWFFIRAPSFFDEVCYTGTGTSGETYSHNLGVVPELMIVKCRAGGAYNWDVWSKSLSSSNQILRLNTTGAESASGGSFNSTAPTSSVFTVGNNFSTNGGTGYTYVNYLFATCAGVSKVGSYTGTGTTKQIDCGFTAGARFVLIKRTDSTGDWYVWDTARGIVSGNDPYLLLASTAAEVTNTDYIDTYSAGFEISSTAPAAINANGGSFIFLAIS
jgi:hypothetical protein